MNIEAIRRALTKPGKSRGGLAEAMHVHQSQITRLLNGTRSLKTEEVPLVAEYLDLPEHVLVSPQASSEAGIDLGGISSVAVQGGPSFEQRVGRVERTIPEIDLRAGASYSGGVDEQEWNIPIGPNEAINGHQAIAIWGLPEAFVERELGLSFGHADIIQIRGDSMDDGTVHALVSGDRVIIDRRDTDPRQGGVFAVWDGDGVIVKQVELVRGTEPAEIICKSRNKNYDPIRLMIDGNVHIIGRVAGKISRM